MGTPVSSRVIHTCGHHSRSERHHPAYTRFPEGQAQYPIQRTLCLPVLSRASRPSDPNCSCSCSSVTCSNIKRQRQPRRCLGSPHSWQSTRRYGVRRMRERTWGLRPYRSTVPGGFGASMSSGVQSPHAPHTTTHTTTHNISHQHGNICCKYVGAASTRVWWEANGHTRGEPQDRCEADAMCAHHPRHAPQRTRASTSTSTPASASAFTPTDSPHGYSATSLGVGLRRMPPSWRRACCPAVHRFSTVVHIDLIRMPRSSGLGRSVTHTARTLCAVPYTAVAMGVFYQRSTRCS